MPHSCSTASSCLGMLLMYSPIPFRSFLHQGCWMVLMFKEQWLPRTKVLQWLGWGLGDQGLDLQSSREAQRVVVLRIKHSREKQHCKPLWGGKQEYKSNTCIHFSSIGNWTKTILYMCIFALFTPSLIIVRYITMGRCVSFVRNSGKEQELNSTLQSNKICGRV